MEAELHIDDEPMVAIFVNKDTQEDEVVKLFKTKVRELFKQISESEKNHPRTSSNIKRDRKWYWKNKEGLGYQKIWNEVSKENKGISKDTITKAIQQYKKVLGVEL